MNPPSPTYSSSHIHYYAPPVKTASVPHYTKHNGKCYYAVRLCPQPAPEGIYMEEREPYTIYRRWDDFSELSQRLSSMFPIIEDAPTPFHRQVPRLSKKMVLFVTNNIIYARREELDLYVRLLFELPGSVTECDMIKDFFGKWESDNQIMRAGMSMRAVSDNRTAAPQRPRGDTLDVARPSLNIKRSTPELRRFGMSNEDDHTVTSPNPSFNNYRFPLSPLTPLSPNLSRPSIDRKPGMNGRYPGLGEGFAPMPPRGPSRAGSNTSTERGATPTSTFSTSTGQTTPRAGANRPTALSPAFEEMDEAKALPILPPQHRPALGMLRKFASLQDMQAANIIRPKPIINSPSVSPLPSSKSTFSPRMMLPPSPPRPPLSRLASAPVISSPRRPSNPYAAPPRGFNASPRRDSVTSAGHSISSLESIDSYYANNKSGGSAAALGFSSRESLDWSDLSSPNLSAAPATPPTPLLAGAETEPKWHQDGQGSLTYNNWVPLPPFFPIPPSMQSPPIAYSRSRASSLARQHQPVLEPIVGSPDLTLPPLPTTPFLTDSTEQSSPSLQNITLKAQHQDSNVVLRLPRSIPLHKVQTKIEKKFNQANITLFSEGSSLKWCVTPGSIKAVFGSAYSDPAFEQVEVSEEEGIVLRDETSWLFALESCGEKITIRIS